MLKRSDGHQINIIDFIMSKQNRCFSAIFSELFIHSFGCFLFEIKNNEKKMNRFFIKIT